jgi:imidazoleglycerol-phosphate dehydratase / histidinol-phosphatase
MKKVLFIDRDGTLIYETPDEQIDNFAKLQFLPGAFKNMALIAAKTDYVLTMVTNQDGLGTERFPEDTFWPVHSFIQQAFKNEGVVFASEHIDRTFPQDNAPTRKPRTGMLTQYLTGEYDLANSFVIGDRLTDVELAKNLGCKAIFIDHGHNMGLAEVADKVEELQQYIALTTNNWDDIYAFLRKENRTATVTRKTNETDITITVDLDGTGKANIETGLHFFNHMLDQIARHSGIDLTVVAKGDLHIDEHHTIEDTAITLGEVFLKALGDKKGIERYGFCLPMDDALAQVAIDFGGRNWIEWEAEFKREKVGDVPTEMFFHFFKSFSDAAKCNLNIKAEGDNEHHKIEAIFKAFAKAIKMAVKKDYNSNVLPSTKGTL